MTLSIIIPTLNEANNIVRLIDSILYSSHYDSTNVEIVVVDSPNSHDGTLGIAKSKGVVTGVIGPERSSQRNYGATLAKGIYLYFVDADMEFSPNLLKDILANLDPNKLIVVPERVPVMSIYTKAINLEKNIYDNNPHLTASRIMSKYAFFTSGGYNPEMVSGEDWDLHSRLVDSGKTVIHLTTPILHHEDNLGFFQSIKKKIYYAKKLTNYQVGIQSEVNPLYRYGVLFSKPSLYLRQPLALYTY
jgi:glycosyltransferase involved in cell wall biosynthesis